MELSAMREMSRIRAEIRSDLQSIAQAFALRYDPDACHCLVLPKRAVVLRNYLVSPGPDFSGFGSPGADRVRNVRAFVESKAFARLVAKGSTSASAMSRLELEHERHLISQIEAGLRKEYEEIYRQIERHLRGTWLILATRPETQREQAELSRILLHEFIHVLLIENSILFQAVGKSWRLDEGLAACMADFVGKDIIGLKRTPRTILIEIMSKQARVYLRNGRWWKEQLREKVTPQERKDAILAKLHR